MRKMYPIIFVSIYNGRRGGSGEAIAPPFPTILAKNTQKKSK